MNDQPLTPQQALNNFRLFLDCVKFDDVRSICPIHDGDYLSFLAMNNCD